MLVTTTKSFDKSIEKFRDKKALVRLQVFIEKLETANTLKEISNVIPIVNYPFLYRAKIGDYRLFLEHNENDKTLTVLLIEYTKRNEKTYKKYK